MKKIELNKEKENKTKENNESIKEKDLNKKIFVKNKEMNNIKILYNKKIQKNEERYKKNLIRNKKILKNKEIKKNPWIHGIIINIPLLIFFIIFLPLSTSENIRKLSTIYYEVSFTVMGEGNQRILGETMNVPSEIYVNNMKQNSNSLNIELRDMMNDIIVRWESRPPCKEMFKNCENIVKIDLSNFDTSEIQDMEGMFYGCTKLKSINFGNINTEKVKTMTNMFFDCKSIETLDLSKFNTQAVNEMDGMFKNAKSLLSLDLSSFKTTSVYNMNNLFYNCKSLIYLNLVSFEETTSNSIYDIFFNINSTLIYCIDSSKSPKIYEILYQKKNIQNNCGNDCFKGKTKLITEERKCVDDCLSYNSKYQYESNNVCYEDDPFRPPNNDGYEFNGKDPNENNNDDEESQENPNNNNDDEESQENPNNNNDDEESQENPNNNNNEENQENSKNNEIDEGSKDNNDVVESTQKFSSENFFKESQITKNEELSNKDEVIKNLKEDIINGNLTNLLTNLINGTKQDLIAEYKDITYQITTSANQNNGTYNNISTINLGDCEEKLKKIYHIDKNLPLIILKIDYKMEGLLIPVIGYEVYHPENNSQLDLNYCNDTTIKLNIPVSIDEDKVYKYDPNSDFYNDDCYAYTTENGTDIILNDRQSEYSDNNLSLCENNCTFNGYDSNTKKALCECETKVQINYISNITSDENILSNNFNSTNSDSSSTNIATMKCVSLLFSKNGLLKNIGSYILIFTIGLFGVSIVIFYKCGYELIESHIKDILALKTKKSKKKFDVENTHGPKNGNKKKKKKLKLKISNPFKRLTTRKMKNSSTRISEQNIMSISKIELRKAKSTATKRKKEKVATYKSNKVPKKDKYMVFKESEYNYMNYKDALLYDKRKFSQYYCCLTKSKIPILFAFYPMNDYNIKIIKICLFFLSFVTYFAVNTFFFNESTIHQIYIDGGNYNFSYFLPKIIISFIVCYIINNIIIYFFLSERNLLEIKNVENLDEISDKADSVKRCLIIKYIIFFILSFVFLIVFWYYLSSFCAVYQNTQIYLLINTVISFLISLIYPIFFNILPSILRISSLKSTTSECVYKTSKIIQIL